MTRDEWQSTEEFVKWRFKRLREQMRVMKHAERLTALDEFLGKMESHPRLEVAERLVLEYIHDLSEERKRFRRENGAYQGSIATLPPSTRMRLRGIKVKFKGEQSW